MAKKVVLVGHCGPDSSYLRLAVSRAAGPSASILIADDETELRQMLGQGVDLILLNRQLDYGFSTEEGVELIRGLRDDFPAVRSMLVSNYPDAQRDAIAAGALPGFGKRELSSPHVAELIRAALADDRGS